MKQGEQEAKMILERKGVAFDDNYHDDNSRPSMPDFKYLDEERFLEVTHTLHNNAIITHINRFHRKSTAEQLEIMEKVEMFMIESMNTVIPIQRKEWRNTDAI